MPFVPHTDADVREMLATIGVSDIDALFDEIPPELRITGLDGIPEALSEMQIGRLMSERAQRDGRPLSFLGAGAYEHHIPSAVWAITTRGEFYSAYTPYQAEASQGTLQVIYEYQSMITSLTGLEVSNASLYDGGSAVAEAALMAVRAHRKSKSLRLLVPATLNPNYRRVAVSTRASRVRTTWSACPAASRRPKGQRDTRRATASTSRTVRLAPVSTIVPSGLRPSVRARSSSVRAWPAIGSMAVRVVGYAARVPGPGAGPAGDRCCSASSTRS